MEFAVVKISYHDGLRFELDHYFASITTSSFDDDVWVFGEQRKSAGHTNDSYTVYFGDANESIFKYFAITSLKNGNSISSVASKVKALGTFVRFLQEGYPEVPFRKINRPLITQYKRFIAEFSKSKGTKESYWTAVTCFFHDMHGWPELPDTPPLGRNNPFSRTNAERKHDTKYVPEYVIQQYDIKFKDERLPLHQRLIYWIARSIPSRITEVTGMDIDCLKPYRDKWVIIMPTWKQNGGYIEPQIRRIYLKYEGHGKFLIDMIREQQKVSSGLQHRLLEKNKGMMFTYQRVVRKIVKDKIAYVPYGDEIIIANRQIVGDWFRRAPWEITDEDGSPYFITSHQLRHNGITDRAWAGFNVVEIRDMTGHQGDAMIETSYTHVVPKETIKAQQKVIDKRNGQTTTTSRTVMFRGRILNMDEQTEKRLLKNLRAIRIGKIGICSDITACKNNPFECLDCDDFIPNADELDYFENQVLEWAEKAARFRDHEYMRQNVEYNLSLNQRIVDKIKRVINGGEHAKVSS